MSSPLERMKAAEAAKRTNNPHITIEEIADALGNDSEDFLAAMAIIDDLVANPASYSGARAAVEATRLSAIRTRIGATAQIYKTLAVGNADLRKRKDVLMVMYDALIENIQCLKTLAKYEREIIGNGY